MPVRAITCRDSIIEANHRGFRRCGHGHEPFLPSTTGGQIAIHQGVNRHTQVCLVTPRCEIYLSPSLNRNPPRPENCHVSACCSGGSTSFGFLGTGLAIIPRSNLRVTRVESDGGIVLQIDGRLVAESLNALEQACEDARLQLTLNLEGLRWIDDQGAETLRQLIAGGTVVTGASPFVALRLNEKEE